MVCTYTLELWMATSTLQKQQLIPLAALLTLLIVTLLTLLALLFRLPAIETDLLQRTRQALTEAGLPTGYVRFHGRDSVLTGTIGSESEAASIQDVVASVWGVRTVNNHLVSASSNAAASDPAEQSGGTQPVTEPASIAGLHQPSREHPIEQVSLEAIRFEYSRAELDEEAVAALQQVVTELEKHPDMRIEVSAHTDDKGTALGNTAVTQARAEVVRNYLLSQGIEAKRVAAKGYGSTRPLADNATEEGRKQNRRIEITVTGE